MIQFKGLRKSFGDREILRGIDFKIHKGEILFILGTSGTGKSVTLKLIVGLLKATSGEIWIDGENVTNYSEEQFFHIRQKCGMVFQHPALFDSLTVYDNVAFGLRKSLHLKESEIRPRVEKCLEMVHVKDVEGKLPQQISYGTQKRVSLARTVAIEPKILLFDEPTTGLDPITTNAVNNLIQELSNKMQTTSVVVSHDMNCALAIADRIVVLDKGEVIAEGTPKEIMNNTHPLVVEFMAEVKNA
ncbi:MAG: ABC transporter ATP-binding protein [Bdellovibrionales bacterium]|nr:ABC transporter ATP-binding protein [Bdellovibrionales bacterium]